MDAPQDPSNEPGVLRPTRGTPNLATGVGIQVIDAKNVPVKFGEEALVGTSMNGDYVLNYTARYFQTGNQVTPGRADGTATFSIEYK
ncbi:Type-1 fimbrial protein, A chain precursor [compost metagenome]